MLSIRPPVLRSRAATRVFLLLFFVLLALHIYFPWDKNGNVTTPSAPVIVENIKQWGWDNVQEGIKLIGDTYDWDTLGFTDNNLESESISKSRKLYAKGDLSQLVSSSSNPPNQRFFDLRTAAEKLRLTSTRFLPSSIASSQPSRSIRRSHILVTGGFGSLGRHVVRELFFRNKERQQDEVSDLFFGADWESGSARLRRPDKEGNILEVLEKDDVIITVLDVQDRSKELEWLLKNADIARGRMAAWEHERATRIQGESDILDESGPVDPRTNNFATSEVSVEKYIKSGKLRVVIGDIRNEEILTNIFKAPKFDSPVDAANEGSIEPALPPISGVIHLASYGSNFCSLNKVDCADVSYNGTTALLEAMIKAPSLPWIVLPSAVSHQTHVDADTFLATSSNSDASLLNFDPSLLALQAVQEYAAASPLHAISLKILPKSNLFGDIFASRRSPILDIMQKALADAPIQIDGTTLDNFGFMSYTALASSVADAVDMLDMAAETNFVSKMAFVSDVNVIPPDEQSADGKVGLEGLTLRLIHLTKSDSPLARLIERREQTRKSSKSQRKVLRQQLGNVPTFPLQLELKSFLIEMLTKQNLHLSDVISRDCSTAPSIEFLEQSLSVLDGCQTQLLTILDGTFHFLGCPANGEDVFTIKPALSSMENMNTVRFHVSRDGEGKLVVHMTCPSANGGEENIVYHDESSRFLLESQSAGKIVTPLFYLRFIQRDAHSFILFLHDDHEKGVTSPRPMVFQRNEQRTGFRAVFNPLDPKAHGSSVLLRANPICCEPRGKNFLSRSGFLDFTADDPLTTSTILFPSLSRKTSMADSTYAIQRCKLVKAESEKVRKLLAWLRDTRDVSADTICHRRRADVSTWMANELPICHVDCSAPIPCVASALCRCTYDDICGSPATFGPFAPEAHSPYLSFNNSNSEIMTTTERVDMVPWSSVLLPVAKSLFLSPSLAHLAKPHFVDIGSVDTHLNFKECYDLNTSNFTQIGDHFLATALKQKSFKKQDADFDFVPFYQNCYSEFLKVDPLSKLLATIAKAEKEIATMSNKRISAARVVAPFFGNVGSCVSEAEMKEGPPPPMDEAISIQTLGMFHTPCVKDHDVIVPQVALHTKALLERYGDLDILLPSSRRRHLAFYGISPTGFGTLVQRRLECSLRDQPGILWQQMAKDKDLLQTIAESRFCIIPRGDLGSLELFVEAIWLGCIPVFVGDRIHLPFSDIFDYSTISFTIPELSTPSIYLKLQQLNIPNKLDQMQAALLKIRDAFLYQEGSEWERKGPIFTTLVSLSLRVKLKYPLFTVENC